MMSPQSCRRIHGAMTGGLASTRKLLWICDLRYRTLARPSTVRSLSRPSPLTCASHSAVGVVELVPRLLVHVARRVAAGTETATFADAATWG
jgi:hypothetical protein